MSLDEHWNYLWSERWPTQAEVDARMLSENSRLRAQRREAVIADYRARHPEATTPYDNVVYELALWEQALRSRR
jgi:hypothetical protein